MVVRGVPARRRRCVRVSLLAIVVVGVLSTGAAQAAEPSPIGVHSMLYLTHPFGAKRAMFREAAAVGASTIRVDVELPAIFPAPPAAPDWSGVDQYMALARTYHLRVLADLTGTPWYMADCPAGTPFDATYLCPPFDARAWGAAAGAVAAHTRGVIDDFEIINEPDGGWAFHGTAQQYAGILAASYDAIHAADPRAVVALGGLENVGSYGATWLSEVFATPGFDAVHKFDIANIHVRTSASGAAPTVARLAAVLRRPRVLRPAVGDRDRLPGRSRLPDRSRLPQRRGVTGQVDVARDPGDARCRCGDGVRHRTRLDERALRLRGHPPERRSADGRPAVQPASVVLRRAGVGSPARPRGPSAQALARCRARAGLLDRGCRARTVDHSARLRPAPTKLHTCRAAAANEGGTTDRLPQTDGAVGAAGDEQSAVAELNATLSTDLVSPVSGPPSSAPVATSQSRTVSSVPPEASVLPSGLNATLRTKSVCPVRVCDPA